MSDVDMWTLIVGFFTPVIISVIQQPKWSDALRSGVAFLCCIIISVVTLFLNNGVSFSNVTIREWVTAVLVILVTSISTYKGWWKPTGISPAIEKATSGAAGAPQQP